MPGFAIGAEEHERVSVDVISSHMDAELRWLNAQVAVHAGGFSGEFVTDFLARDVSLFLNQLRELYRTLKGAAQFTTWEKQIELKLEGNGRGAISVIGEAMDIAGTGNLLRFRLEVDQTYLPKVIADLETVCAAHPDGAV